MPLEKNKFMSFDETDHYFLHKKTRLLKQMTLTSPIKLKYSSFFRAY